MSASPPTSPSRNRRRRRRTRAPPRISSPAISSGPARRCASRRRARGRLRRLDACGDNDRASGAAPVPRRLPRGLHAHRERHIHPLISAKGYLAASGPRRIAGFGQKKLPLEGFLFPSTYNFDRKSTSASLVHAQLRAFEINWGNVDLAYAQSKHLTPYDVLTIASMVEREAVVPSERKLIAAVIYNRLHAHMPLGIDATIRYGLHVPGTKPLLQSELDSDNPYNTRKFPGLPPTPIANPGLASIEAAAHPARVDYLYFVRKPDKRHHYFTPSYQDFVNHEHLYGY